MLQSRLKPGKRMGKRGRERLAASDLSRHYSLDEAQREFGVPVRKLAFLIRTGELEALFDDGVLTISGQQLFDYVSQTGEVRQRHHVSYLKTLGPGLITGISDDDPSGIGTYTQVGSAYGFGLLWLGLYMFPMMVSVQETVARIGIVTRRGLSSVIKERFGKKTLLPLVILLVIANTVNIGADIGAMVSALQLLIPVDFRITLVVLGIGIALLEAFVPYHRYSRILKWLTISLFAYVITVFLVKPDWLAAGRSLAIPQLQMNAGFLTAVVATLGTTITPYLFFWQASEEVEEIIDRGEFDDSRTTATCVEIGEMHKDTYFGMFLSQVLTIATIITAATVLNANGITDVADAATAAAILKPLAGPFASALFTAGIFGVGLLAVPVLAGASAYALSEMFGWKEGLGQKVRNAPGFYAIIVLSVVAGLVLNLLGIDPIRSLYYAAVLNGIVAPILMFFIFRIGSDEKIMGPFTCSTPIRIIGWVTTILMGSAAVVLIVMLAGGL